MLRISLLLILYSINIIFCELPLHEYTDIVETDKGKVQGQIMSTVGLLQKYSAFKGIPYAKPPVGYGRRFRRPVEADPWQNVIIATREPVRCPQIDPDSFSYVGDDDCLYLNVYTPELNFTNPKSRAVMVWIHEGSFIFGHVRTSRYGPDFFMEKNVVIVAMNYRVGILGFLSLNPQYFDANNGLKDQIQALKWVQKNIEKFGGDPTKVTIFGESSGGSSVEFHRLSPLSQELFRASIAMSGTALHPWAFLPKTTSIKYGRRYVNLLGFGWMSDSYLYKRMLQLDARTLTTRMLDLALATRDLPTRPTIEDEHDAIYPVLIKSPQDIYKSGKFSFTPHMIGFTNKEAVAFLGFLGPIPFLIGKTLTENVISTVSDAMFIVDVDRTQQYYNHYSNASVYYYRNSFDYDQSLHKVDGRSQNGGCGHADDVAHLFWMTDKKQPSDPNSDIGKHRNKMVTMWTNFAKYLKPTVPEIEELDVGINWPESNRDGRHLEIDKILSVSDTRPVDERVKRIEAKEDHFNKQFQ